NRLYSSPPSHTAWGIRGNFAAVRTPHSVDQRRSQCPRRPSATPKEWLRSTFVRFPDGSRLRGRGRSVVPRFEKRLVRIVGCLGGGCATARRRRCELHRRPSADGRVW